MQKNRKKSAAILTIVMLLSLAGCSIKAPTPPVSSSVSSSQTIAEPSAESSVAPAEEPSAESAGEASITKAFGSYTVPSGWVEAEKHSTEQKAFYVVNGTENEAQPDNISVESGKNGYAAEDHEKFRDAIMSQLGTQLNGIKANVSGGGFYTANDYMVYKFTVEEEAVDIVTTQYYIVSDYKYVLIHETARKDSADANEAAETILNSFTWAEPQDAGQNSGSNINSN